MGRSRRTGRLTTTWLLLVAALAGCDELLDEAGRNIPIADQSITCNTTMAVDGSASDWSGYPVTLGDAAGDGGSHSGLDLTALYVACDATNFYLRLSRSGLGTPLGEGHNFWTYFNADQSGGPSFAVEAYHDATGTRFPRLWDTTGAAHYGQYVLLLEPIPAATTTTELEFSWPRSQVSVAVPYLLEFYTHHMVGGVWGDNGDINDAATRLTIVP